MVRKMFAAINREGLVLGIGKTPDEACWDAGPCDHTSIWRVIPACHEVAGQFRAVKPGADVKVRIVNGWAVI